MPEIIEDREYSDDDYSDDLFEEDDLSDEEFLKLINSGVDF